MRSLGQIRIILGFIGFLLAYAENTFANVDDCYKKPVATRLPNQCQSYESADGLLIMEAEGTTSHLDKWILKTDVNDYTGSGHLEFTGNNQASGPATSPLKYKFKINEGGHYRLIIRARKRLDGAEPDKSNDSYVRVTGDYGEGPNAGDNHQDDARLADLKRNVKFFGGNASGWGWAEMLDLGGHDNKRRAIYDFKAGETYELTISGRSQNYNFDRIVFYKMDTYTKDAAKKTISVKETTCLDEHINSGSISPVDDLSNTVVNCSTVKLQWADTEGEERYRIWRKKEGAAHYAILAEVAANTTAYLDEFVTEIANYDYKIAPMQGATPVNTSNVSIADVSSCQDGCDDSRAAVELQITPFDERFKVLVKPSHKRGIAKVAFYREGDVFIREFTQPNEGEHYRIISVFYTLGSYYKIVVTNNCGVETVLTGNIQNLSINRFKEHSTVLFVPEGSGRLHYQGLINAQVLQVYDIDGRLLGQHKLLGTTGTLSFPYSRGVYMVTLDGRVVKKIAVR